MKTELEILFVGYEDPKHSSFGGYEKITNMPNTSFLDVKIYHLVLFLLGCEGKS